MDQLQQALLADPRNPKLHDRRYQMALESGDLELLREVLADSAWRLRDETYVQLIAALEENSDNFGHALPWREMAVELRDTSENRALLEHCQVQALFSQARATLDKQRLFYHGDSEIAPELDRLEKALVQRDSAGVKACLETLERLRNERRSAHGL